MKAAKQLAKMKALLDWRSVILQGHDTYPIRKGLFMSAILGAVRAILVGRFVR